MKIHNYFKYYSIRLYVQLALHPCAYGTWSHLAPMALCPLILNILIELATHLQRHMNSMPSASQPAQAALANPSHDHPEGIRMPHAKFRADPLKTVAMHKEQRNRHTHAHTQIRFCVHSVSKNNKTSIFIITSANLD